MTDNTLAPLPHSRDTALSLAKSVLDGGLSVEAAACAIEREMQAYATRYARQASASRHAGTVSEEDIQAIWDGTATRDDRVMAFAADLLAAAGTAGPRRA